MSETQSLETLQKYFAEKKYSLAESFLINALKSDRDNKQFLNALTLAYFHQKKIKKSIMAAENLTRLYPDFYEGWNNYAYFLSHKADMSIEELELSKECYSKSIKLEDKRTEGRLGLLKILILSNKNFSKTMPNLAYGPQYEVDDNDVKIRSLIKSIIDIEPTNIQALQMGGLYYKSIGEWSNAITFLENVINRDNAGILLECLYEQGITKDINSFVDFFATIKLQSLRVAELTDFIGEQLKILNRYKFCPKSSNYIFKDSIFNYCDENESFSIEDVFSNKNYKPIVNMDRKMTIPINLSKEKSLFEVHNSFASTKSQNIFEKVLQNLLNNFYNTQVNEKNNSDIWFANWPLKSNIIIQKMNSDKDYDAQSNIFNGADYNSWVSIIMFDTSLSSNAKFEFVFEHLIGGLSVKNKKYKKKSFTLKSQNFLIFPSFLSPRIITKENNVDYYLVNIKPSSDAK